MEQRRLLNSWKEISTYIGRGVRTVQRYEAQFGFPIRRVADHSRASVFAFSDEIDDWLRQTKKSNSASAAEPEGSMEVLRNTSLATSTLSKVEAEDAGIFVIEDDPAYVDEIRSFLCQIGEQRVTVFGDSRRASAVMNEIIEGRHPA